MAIGCGPWKPRTMHPVLRLHAFTPGFTHLSTPPRPLYHVRMPIRRLPPLLVNQIAAGEVIERPASVVKELVENSLDAGARRIDVTVEDGGRQLIRISDDGAGIGPDELPMAVAPHATSKLDSAEQLAAISTLGFRGEALASIASVSRLRIQRRPTREQATDEQAHVIEASGDTVGEVSPAASSPGTVVEVRDLFFNTPARRKFLRAASTEFGHISDMLNRIAMVHPTVAFSLTHGTRRSLDLPANDSPRQRCIEILGADLDEALLEFDAEQAASSAAGGSLGPPAMAVWGLAGLPSIARASAKFQYLCLNGRPVRDRGLSHALREAYRGLLPADRQPVVVALLHVDPKLVDVNVHPTKAEVRFADPNRAHGLLLSAIRQALLGADLTPKARFGSNRSWQLESPPSGQPSLLEVPAETPPPEGEPSGQTASNGAEGESKRAGADAGDGTDRRAGAGTSGDEHANVAGGGVGGGQPRRTGPAARVDGGAGGASTRGGGSGPGARNGSAAPHRADPFVEHFRRMEPGQKGVVYEQLRRAMQQEGHTVEADGADAAAPANGEAEASCGEGGEPAASRPVPKVLQVHESYLVTQDEQGIVIIDQHALHERVMFEELRRRVLEAGRSLESQRLLMPVQVKAAGRRLEALEALGALLERLGIEAEAMGPGTIGIHAFPSFLFDRHVDPAAFLEELLDRVEDGTLAPAGSTADEAALHEVLDMMACKAAVKAGDRLSGEELADLLSRREQIERSSNCPHGRPTQIRLSLKDLEKQFGRA